MNSLLSRPGSRRKLGLAACTLAGILGFAYWFTRPNPYRTANEFAAAIQRRDWGHVYDMASDLEKSKQPWGRDGFIQVMNRVSADLPKELGSREVKGFPGGIKGWMTFMYGFSSVRNLRSGGQQGKLLILPMVRDLDGWHPLIALMPAKFNVLGVDSARTENARLKEAMKLAGIRSFYAIDERVDFTYARIESDNNDNEGRPGA